MLLFVDKRILKRDLAAQSMPLDERTRVGLELKLSSVFLLALVVEEPVRVSVPSHDSHEKSK